MENFIVENAILLDFYDKILQKTSQLAAIADLISQSTVLNENCAKWIGELLIEILDEIKTCLESIHQIFIKIKEREVCHGTHHIEK